eukprot:jgi/Picsp_1/278/NSC_00277-R1_probable proteasome inhibitor-like isoform 1
MVDAKSLLALLRLCPLKSDSRSECSCNIEEDIISRAEGLALAVHMYVVGLGYVLTRTGEGTQCGVDNARGYSADPIAKEADVREKIEHVDWNNTPGVYVFHYTSDGMQDTFHGEVVMKCLIAGQDLIVHVQRHKEGIETTEPENDDKFADCSVSLNIPEYTTGKGVQSSSNLGYKDLDALISKLNCGIGMQLEPSMVRPTPEGLSQRDTETRRNSGPPVGYTSVEMVPSDDDQIDTRVGYGDVVPPGIRHPGSLSEPGGLGRGGGMMVGPHHPIFGPSRIDDPGYDPSIEGRGGLPPGARWDPIGPPGTPGFRPSDFQRRKSSREHPHPDIMPPGRGAGTHWDSFFG